MDNLSSSFWEKRYKERKLGWNIGAVSRPIKEYIDQIEDRTLKILIPGAGLAYEVEYFFQTGFPNVYYNEWSGSAINSFKNRFSEFPESQILKASFFELKGKFDLIIEQTFFCAINPKLRIKYAQKMHDLLKPGGKLTGVLFDFPLSSSGPPYGGSKDEYLSLFSKHFKILTLEKCHNSIPSRMGSELFFSVQKHIK